MKSKFLAVMTAISITAGISSTASAQVEQGSFMIDPYVGFPTANAWWGQTISLDGFDNYSTAGSPVSFGGRAASIIILLSLCTSLMLSGVLFRVAPLQLGYPFYLAALLAGIYLLLLPAVRLFQTRDAGQALVLFNRASYYPCALLFLTAASFAWY